MTGFRPFPPKAVVADMVNKHIGDRFKFDAPKIVEGVRTQMTFADYY